MKLYRIHSVRRMLIASCISLAALSGATESVFLDYTDFKPNADLAWAAAGFSGADALTASDILLLKHAIGDLMAGHYSGFGVSFTETAPGGLFEHIKFGASTTTSDFGLATRLDWRNRHKDDVAYIFTHNFGGIFPSSSYTKPVALDRFAVALAGTASHELGHNLGLQHYDAYGKPDIMAPAYAGVVGQQNTSIMATGSSGLTLAARGTDRAFNPLEKVKLEYADGVAPTLGATFVEVAGPHSTFSSAQLVLGSTLPLSGATAANVDASVTTSGSTEVDMYSFYATIGSKITLNTFSVLDIMEDSTDTSITLFSSTGGTLFANASISYTPGSFMGPGGFYSHDSLIMNFTATYTGLYYVGVSGLGTGDYDLLMTGIDTVPEPATIAGLFAGFMTAYNRSRRSLKNLRKTSSENS